MEHAPLAKQKGRISNRYRYPTLHELKWDILILQVFNRHGCWLVLYIVIGLVCYSVQFYIRWYKYIEYIYMSKKKQYYTKT
jgi:hypothetical protein